MLRMRSGATTCSVNFDLAVLWSEKKADLCGYVHLYTPICKRELVGTCLA